MHQQKRAFNQICLMIFHRELEQSPSAVEYASVSSAAAKDRLYDEKRADLHLKLSVTFQNQSSFPPAAYDIILECLLKDTHLNLFLVSRNCMNLKIAYLTSRLYILLQFFKKILINRQFIIQHAIFREMIIHVQLSMNNMRTWALFSNSVNIPHSYKGGDFSVNNEHIYCKKSNLIRQQIRAEYSICSKRMKVWLVTISKHCTIKM